MTKTNAQKLKSFASEVAVNYSNPEREYNYSSETFEVSKIVPHSDQTATVIFKKSSGKFCAAFFYFIPAKDQWRYWFPTDSHIVGMDGFKGIKEEIEKVNFGKNFEN